jgi:hypothetical protein
MIRSTLVELNPKVTNLDSHMSSWFHRFYKCFIWGSTTPDAHPALLTPPQVFSGEYSPFLPSRLSVYKSLSQSCRGPPVSSHPEDQPEPSWFSFPAFCWLWKFALLRVLHSGVSALHPPPPLLFGASLCSSPCLSRFSLNFLLLLQYFRKR